ncbi:MAG: glutamate---cysteine ligase / carboxylate-amine ligase [Pseudonocardia sp.]
MPETSEIEPLALAAILLWVAVRTVGVEEEFLLVDPATGRPRAVGHAVLATSAAEDAEDDLAAELHREQLETGTKPCHTLDELSAELRSARATAAAAAGDVGVALAPLATSPLAVEPTVSPSRRYEEMARRFGRTVSEQLTCGCHVHVAIDSAEEGVAVLDRIRPWLAPLAALSTNSPFWLGADSGYASFRSQVWQRWPSAGPYGPFGSIERYRAFVDSVLDTGTVLDEGMVYLDARLSRQYPTVEVRVADVCREPDDAVLIAALTRALVQTAVDAWRAGDQPDPVRTEVLRLAAWRAGRSGLEGDLLDPGSWRPTPAAEVVARLVEHVRPALEVAGDVHTVRDLLAAVEARGTGTRRQRKVYAKTGTLAAVVRDATDGTLVH